IAAGRASAEVDVKLSLTLPAVNAMIIESVSAASPESDAPAEQAVSSRLVAAAAATHVMMRGVFIVLLEFADRRGVVHQHSSIASVSDVLTWRSVHVRMLETVKDDLTGAAVRPGSRPG